MRDKLKQFVRHLTELVDRPGPVIEIGSLQTEAQEEYADLRPFFASRFWAC